MLIRVGPVGGRDLCAYIPFEDHLHGSWDAAYRDIHILELLYLPHSLMTQDLCSDCTLRWLCFLSFHSSPAVGLGQWLPTLGPQTFLNCISQKTLPAQVVVKASGSCSPGTSREHWARGFSLDWKLVVK